MENYPLMQPEQMFAHVPAFENVDQRFWVPCLSNAQLDNIAPNLSLTEKCCNSTLTSYYEELCSQVEAGAVTAANQYFLDNFLYASLANYAYGLFVAQNIDRNTNTGNLLPSGDGQTPSPVSSASYEAKTYLGRGSNWLNAGIRFLKKNLADYPTYAAQLRAGEAPPAPQKESGGIYFYPEYR